MLKWARHVEEVASEGAQKEHSLEARMPRVKSQPCHFLGDFGQFPKETSHCPVTSGVKWGPVTLSAPLSQHRVDNMITRTDYPVTEIILNEWHLLISLKRLGHD